MKVRHQIIYWRGIPAQVRVEGDGPRVTRPLSPRFQEAIDQAAMVAGAEGSDEYLAGWRVSDWRQEEGDARQVADRLQHELEAAYPETRLSALIRKRGRETPE